MDDQVVDPLKLEELSRKEVEVEVVREVVEDLQKVVAHLKVVVREEVLEAEEVEEEKEEEEEEEKEEGKVEEVEEDHQEKVKVEEEVKVEGKKEVKVEVVQIQNLRVELQLQLLQHQHLQNLFQAFQNQ